MTGLPGIAGTGVRDPGGSFHFYIPHPSLSQTKHDESLPEPSTRAKELGLYQTHILCGLGAETDT